MKWMLKHKGYQGIESRKKATQKMIDNIYQSRISLAKNSFEKVTTQTLGKLKKHDRNKTMFPAITMPIRLDKSTNSSINPNPLKIE